MPELLPAVAAVVGTPLFDEEWYAAQTGTDYPSRNAAAADYVLHAGTRAATPHPLFEPAWVYPGGRWRRDGAPDPLTHYLARRDRERVATHPLLPGDAVAWARSAGLATPLPHTVGRAVTWGEVRAAAFAGAVPALRADDVAVSVVIPVGDHFRPVCHWLRRLYRTEIIRGDRRAELIVCATDPAHRRMAALLALTLPGTRVVEGDAGAGREAAAGAVTVEVDAALEPPPWPWLHFLTERLADPAVGVVVPLLVERDQTVVAAGAAYDGHRLVPFLRGETPADAARAASRPVPGLLPGVRAFRTGDDPDRGPVFVATGARLVVPDGFDPLRTAPVPSVDRTTSQPPDSAEAWRAAGFEAPRRPITVVEGRPALRWAIDIAAPLAPRGRRWGDDHFARSLATSLEALGQWVTVDHPETRGRASRDHDDVVLVIRGLEPVPLGTQRVGARLLWVISHPEGVTEAECAAYDVVLAAGPAWAAQRSRAWGREIRPLLQCTDARRFHPGLAEPDTGPEVLFVGNSRGELRPAVRAALDAGLDLTLYGDGWAGLVDSRLIAGISVRNEELGTLYASAGVVLNDHWADMREQGFVSNRVFDVLACGGRLLTDDVAGLREVTGDAVQTWRDADDLRRLAGSNRHRAFPDTGARQRTAERVVAEHSFDARAAELLDAALSLGRH